MRDRLLVRWIVRAYPRSFRAALGDDFADTLHDRIEAGRATGMSTARLYALAIADTLRNAPPLWIDASGKSRRNPASPKQGRTMFDKLRQDVRYAARAWARRPGLASVAVLTLAIGIGANTALFSIVNAVLLRPLPYQDADRILTMWGRTPTNPRALVSYAEYQEFKRQTRSFEELALYLGQSVNLTGVAEPQRITGIFVSGSFFNALGLKPERGRLFNEQESEPGAVKPLVVITREFWQRQFNGDPAALGSTLTLNGTPLTVVGVLAPPFDLKSVPGDGWFIGGDVFIPVGSLPTPDGLMRAGPSMLGLAKLELHATIADARAELDVVSKRLAAEFPLTQATRSVFLEPAQETIVGSSRMPLLLLLAAVGAVLLIASMNVSNLLLARAIDRQKEIALRAALGASRFAVTRQLLVEAGLLAAIAATSGLILGRWSLQALAWLRPPMVPIPDRVPLDATVLLFTMCVGLVVAVLCAVLPAARAARTDLSRVLQAGSHRASAGNSRTRDVLVVVEVAVSVVLVAVCGLLVQSLLALQRVNTGFESSNVFTLQFRLPPTKYRTPEDIARFFKAATERVRSAPGVTSAALVRRVPFSGNRGDTPYLVEGQATAAGAERQAGQNMITPGYFQTMRIPLMRGRDFTDRDNLDAPGAVIVNETLARAVWGTEDPIGKRVKVPESPDWLSVVGVVGDVKHLGPTEPPVPQLYLAHYQAPLIFSSLVARTAGPPMSVANDVRKAIWSVDSDQPVWSVMSLDDIVARGRGQARFLALLLAVFAGVAVVLAAVGIYGVMSYAVTQRTHEIGIRLALGASSSRVRRDVVRRGLTLTIVAVVVGMLAAVGVARVASNLLFEVGPGNPTTLSLAALVLAIVSVAACYVPALRASRVDPVIALTQE